MRNIVRVSGVLVACMALAAAALAAACGVSGGPEDPCSGVNCNLPPEDVCADDSTLLIWGSNGTCNPDTGECDYPLGEKACPHGCEEGKCLGHPSGDFELLVPDSTVLCTSFAWSGDSVEYVWESKGRVTLNPGSILLPRNQETIQADPVAYLEVSPGVTAFSPDPGLFRREIRGDENNGIYRYEFEQLSTAGTRGYQVALAVEFEVVNGQAQQPVVVLDDHTLFFGPGYEGSLTTELEAGGMLLNSGLVSCRRDQLEERERILAVENGDRLTFTTRGYDEEFTWPQPQMVYVFEIAEARLEHGNDTRVVTDFFDLAATVNHHGCCPGYLVILNEPIGDIHRLTIDEFTTGWDVLYQDQLGQTLERYAYQDL
jgi:hypothetical protein